MDQFVEPKLTTLENIYYRYAMKMTKLSELILNQKLIMDGGHGLLRDLRLRDDK